MPPTTDDLEIFVFTAANPTAQENLLKSIKYRIQPESIVFDGFGEAGKDLRDELGRIKETAGGFYAWGAEPRGHAATTWSKMARSDYILAYYDKSYHYVARVLATFHEQDLATSIWGTNEETGKTWEYMYFLTKPVKIDASASWIADLLSSKELSFKESSWMYQGFNRIGGKNREAILRTCGSVQGFVNRLMDHEGDSVPPQLLLASGESEEKAETSLDTDRIAQGYQLEKLTVELFVCGLHCQG